MSTFDLNDIDQVDEAYARFLFERRAEILGRIVDAAERSGRAAEDVDAIAVSKTVGPDEVHLAWLAGWESFGENRPQELTRKLEALSSVPGMENVRFDMIGNLQKNKINQVIGRVALIHSISSSDLAQAVSSHSEARNIVSDVLIEVNVSGEASKSGFSPDELRAQIEDIVDLPGISVKGLMTMAPADNPSAARATFSGLRELAEELRARTGLALDVLSCGMSDDFEIAVEEGSTLVRIGRCAFDQAYELG